MSHERKNDESQRDNKIFLHIFGKEITLGAIFLIIVLPIILSVIANIITNKYFAEQPSQSDTTYIESFSNRLDKIEVAITNFEERLKIVEDAATNSPIHIDGDHNTINLSHLVPITNGIIKTTKYSVEMACLLSSPSWTSKDVIAIDPVNNLEICAEELENKKILIPYKDNNQENYFYGQFNENNQWDGKCVINVYENSNLQLIMEAEYDNGVLLSYKQIDKYVTKAGIKVWNISHRTNEDNYSKGETWYYFRGDNEYTQSFKIDSINVDDILDVAKFEDNIKSNSWLEGYYYGNTSDNYFNDETNQAFMIKYFKDQTVRTLYIGNFKEGQFCDYTGNAWYIVKNSDTNYMYYKGFFDEGKTVNNNGYIFENNLSLERIEELLKENNFNIKLNWNETFYKEQDS